MENGRRGVRVGLMAGGGWCGGGGGDVGAGGGVGEVRVVRSHYHGREGFDRSEVSTSRRRVCV